MSIKLPLISVNGIFGATISPFDRGFTYGDGIFETCRYCAGKIPLWPFHCERLLNSAQRLHIPLDEAVLMNYLAGLLSALESAGITAAVVKIQITRGASGRGYRIPEGLEPTYCISAFPVAPLQSDNYLQGVDVRICEQRLSTNKSLAGMKHLNRLEQILARVEWQDEYAEGLLMDESGHLIEATVSNLFIVKDSRLYTPDLAFCGVAGVLRRSVIETFAPRLNVDVEVRAIKLDCAQAADELFLCNSVYGIWPVNSLVDERNEHRVVTHFVQQSLTRKLQHLLEQSFSLVD